MNGLPDDVQRRLDAFRAAHPRIPVLARARPPAAFVPAASAGLREIRAGTIPDLLDELERILRAG